MQQILNITNEPKQSMVIYTENGDSLILSLEYVNSQIGWYFSLSGESKKTNCRRITTCPNLIRDKQNTFRFGIACHVEDGTEPFFIDDFSTGRAKLYILNNNEVQYIGKTKYGKIF